MGILCSELPKGVRWFGGSPSLTTPAAPKATPTTDEAAVDATKTDELNRRKGRLATMVTGPLGITQTPLVGTKTLLGT
jgi:hypothetical protein